MLGYFCLLYWPATELLADARGTLGFRGTPVENHCSIEIHQEYKDCHGNWLACNKQRYSGVSISKSLEHVTPLTQGEAPQASTGEGMGRGYPPSWLEVWGDRRELPQWGPGQSPGEKRIWCILSITEHFCLQDIANISEMQNNNNIQLSP